MGNCFATPPPPTAEYHELTELADIKSDVKTPTVSTVSESESKKTAAWKLNLHRSTKEMFGVYTRTLLHPSPEQRGFNRFGLSSDTSEGLVVEYSKRRPTIMFEVLASGAVLSSKFPTWRHIPTATQLDDGYTKTCYFASAKLTVRAIPTGKDGSVYSHAKHINGSTRKRVGEWVQHMDAVNLICSYVDIKDVQLVMNYSACAIPFGLNAQPFVCRINGKLFQKTILHKMTPTDSLYLELSITSVS